MPPILDFLGLKYIIRYLWMNLKCSFHPKHFALLRQFVWRTADCRSNTGKLDSMNSKTKIPTFSIQFSNKLTFFSLLHLLKKSNQSINVNVIQYELVFRHYVFHVGILHHSAKTKINIISQHVLKTLSSHLLTLSTLTED